MNRLGLILALTTLLGQTGAIEVQERPWHPWPLDDARQETTHGG